MTLLALYTLGFLAVLAYQLHWRAWQAHGWRAFLPVPLWPLLLVAAVVYVATCFGMALLNVMERRG